MKNIIKLLLISIFLISCTQKEFVIYKGKTNDELIKSKNKKYERNNDTTTNIPNDIIIQEERYSDINYTNTDITKTIAVVYSSKYIGKYSIKISNISSLYMLSSNDDFSLKFFDINSESFNDIQNILNSLKNKNISKIMFYLTKNNVSQLNKYDDIDYFDIYLPLINKNDTEFYGNNIIFGGIDYKKQFEVLKDNSNSHLIEVYDNTYRNKLLHDILEKNNLTSYILSGKYPNYKRFLKEHPFIRNSSLILNLNVVKSSILMSQIIVNEDIDVSQILSTQNNFTPLLFQLTQTKDTQKLIIANSILDVNEQLHNLNRLNDTSIKYDWVNYSTILGLEYLKYKKYLLFNNIEIINNQVDYPVNLYKTNKKSFTPYIKELNDTIY